MTPRILLAATSRWFATARLAKAFVSAGCEIDVVCPRGHPVMRTRAASSIYPYHALAPLRSTGAAIDAAQPDFLIPCDDLATAHLQRLYCRALRLGESAAAMRALFERSLGEPSSLLVAMARTRLIALAHDEGIRSPATAVAHTMDELTDWLVRNGCPAVLKTDGSYGGRGVRVVYTLAEAARAWQGLNSPPSPERAIKRAIVNRDMNYVLPCVLRTRPVVSVQRFVSGQDANSTVACWKGKVLANISVRVLHTLGPQGPASVIQVVDNREISAAVEKLVRQLGLSGLYGFDFLIEERTGDAYLIEMNPRATQIGHLQLGAGQDLPAALHAVLSGGPLRETPSVTDNRVIALFPQEWLRDPASPFLKTAFHDVPWDEADLIRACMEETRVYKAWSRMSAVVSRFMWKLSGPLPDPPGALLTTRKERWRGISRYGLDDDRRL